MDQQALGLQQHPVVDQALGAGPGHSPGRAREGAHAVAQLPGVLLHPVAAGEVTLHGLPEAPVRLAARLVAVLGASQVGQAQHEDGEQMPDHLDVDVQGQFGETAVLALQQVQDAPEGLPLILVPGHERLPRGRLVDTGGLDRGAAEEAGREEHDGAPRFGEVGAELKDLAGPCPEPVATGQRVAGEVQRAPQRTGAHRDQVMEGGAQGGEGVHSMAVRPGEQPGEVQHLDSRRGSDGGPEREVGDVVVSVSVHGVSPG
ncbi:hypothetical protein SAFG77S_08369 [Streptomyces afghaniensis]